MIYLPPRKILSEEEKKEVIELYQKGMSFKSIYKNYGYCNTVVKRTLEENGIRVRERTETRRKKYKIQVEHIAEIPENRETVNCNRIGMKCFYKVNLGSSLHVCDYIGHTGKMRGCEPTECTKYIPRR